MSDEKKIEWTIVPQEWAARYGRWDLFVKPHTNTANNARSFVWMVTSTHCCASANGKETSPDEAMAKASDAALRLSKAFD